MKITSRLLASLTICVAATTLAATLTMQSPQAAGKATIQTDLADYPPDTHVNVTGSGWLPSEVVELTFTETATVPPGGFADGPFVFYATADALGDIANGAFSTDQHDLGVHFLLTAKGVISGRWAQTTFTDNLAGLFQIEGDAIGGTATSHDWNQVYTDKSSPLSHTAGTGAIQFTVDGVNSAQDDTFANSPKDTQDISAWKWGRKSVSSPKTDLAHGFAAAYQDSGYADTYGSTHTLLFVGTDRYASGSNSAISIWFLQHPIGMKSDGTFFNKTTTLAETHQVGDLLIQASLGSTASVLAYKWIGGATPLSPITLTSAQETHAINSGTITMPWSFLDSSGSTSALAQEFFEVGLDLNEVFKATSANLPDFSSFIITSRTSTSQTATLSDFILGNVSSGADITVVNTADASSVNAGAPVGYTVTVSNVGVGAVTSVTLIDPLPLSVNWSISGPNPDGFLLSPWNGITQQVLTLPAGASVSFNASLSVHVTGTSTPASRPSITSTAVVAGANEGADFTSNNTSTASITVVNNGPLATNGTLTTAEDTPKKGTLVASDSDSPTLTYSVVDQTGAHGTVTITDVNTGAYTYTPEANYNGPASFTFKASDGSADSNTATITITVTSVNDAPASILVNGATLNENDVYNLSGSFFDGDPGDTHTVTINWSDGANTVLNLGAGVMSFASSHQYLDDNPTGTSTDNYTVTVTVVDNSGAINNTGAGTATVTVKNVAPIVVMSTSTIALSPGDAFSRPGSFSDVGTLDSWTATVDYGDGSGSHNLTLTAGKTFSLTSPAYTAGDHTVIVSITDDDGGVNTQLFHVLVDSSAVCQIPG